MFSDIKSIDFQPRYNEKGRLFGCLLSFRVTIRFVTFTSEIGYNECLQLGTYTFGDDELRIEPGQDKGTMPTSVSLSSSLSLSDNARFKERASLRNGCAIPRLDRFLSFFLFFSPTAQASHFPALLHLHLRQVALQIARVLRHRFHSIPQHRRRRHRLSLLSSLIPQAWGYLKDEQFAGAKLEVEYKKKQDKREFESAFKPVFLSAVAEQLWKQLTQFKERFVGQNPRGPVPSLVFPNDLSA